LNWGKALPLFAALAVIAAIAGIGIYVDQVFYQTCPPHSLEVRCPVSDPTFPFVALLAFALVAAVVFGALMVKGYGLSRVPQRKTPVSPSD